DTNPSVLARRTDRRGLRQGVAPGVSQRLEHDLEDLLDDRSAGDDLRLEAVLRIGRGVSRIVLARGTDVGERSHGSANVVVLRGETALEAAKLAERLDRPPVLQELAARLQAQVHGRQRLEKSIVERAGDRLTLGDRLELSQARLERQTLLPE